MYRAFQARPGDAGVKGVSGKWLVAAGPDGATQNSQGVHPLVRWARTRDHPILAGPDGATENSQGLQSLVPRADTRQPSIFPGPNGATGKQSHGVQAEVTCRSARPTEVV